MSDTNKPASGEPSPIPSQGSLAPLKPRPSSRRKNPENIPYDWMDYEDLVCITGIGNIPLQSKILTLTIQTPAQAALKMSNELLARKMAQVQANMARLKREIHPLFETWEADILTRLVEVACAAQPNENLDGFPINLAGMPDRETVSRAYVDAAKQVQEDTLYKLGLTHQHYLAIDRYEEVRIRFSIL